MLGEQRRRDKVGLCPYERECLAVATSTSNTWRFCLLVDFIASESSDVRDKVGLCSYKKECLAIAANWESDIYAYMFYVLFLALMDFIVQ